MDRSTSSVEFTLHQAGAAEIHVRLHRLVRGWAAEVVNGISSVGMGQSAREALTAALQPFGEPQVRRLLADLGLLEPSLAVLTLERERLPA